MLKIYDYKGFPNPTRVRIALAEKGLSDKVEFISVDVPGGEHRLPAFVEKNPYATVPVLELEDGTCISECTAITEYVDNLVGEPVLTGRNAKERAEGLPVRHTPGVVITVWLISVCEALRGS